MNEHSAKYWKVKAYWDSGLWPDKRMVRNAVVKGWISTEEYTEIVGEPYEQ